jgi:catechol 2,3-dioxygenase-like lactoylglutathione lyase family enzyme
MVTLGSTVLNVSDIRRAAEFWGKALGYVAPGDPAFLRPEAGDGPRLHLDETDRTHLDLWVDGEEELRAEVERLVALGAKRVEWTLPDGAAHVVLADTEGNLFCVCDVSA